MLKVSVPIALFLILASVVGAPAAVLYSTGFENPPFVPGPLAGQDGWGVFGTSSAVTVQSAVVESGSQAAKIDGAPVQGQTGPFHTDLSTGPLVSLSADLRLDTSSSQGGWQFAGVGPNLIGFLGGINIGANSNIFLITPGFPAAGSFSRDVWHHVDFVFDLGSQTYAFSLDGSLTASNVPFCGSNAGCTGAFVGTFANGLFDTFGIGANDAGYIDNYAVATISTVPEPASVLLVGGGLLALGIVAWRARYKQSA